MRQQFPLTTEATLLNGLSENIRGGAWRVYDALGILAENGLIRRIPPAGSAALYETRVGDNNDHVICRTCGKKTDIDCTVGDAPCLTAADNSGYQIDEAEVIYWGTCPECLAMPQRSDGD